MIETASAAWKQLEEKFVGFQLARDIDCLRRRRARHQGHEGLHALFFRGPEGVGAGQVRHVHVNESEVDFAAAEQRQTVTAVVGRGDPQWQLRLGGRIQEEALHQVESSATSIRMGSVMLPLHCENCGGNIAPWSSERNLPRENRNWGSFDSNFHHATIRGYTERPVADMYALTDE